MKKELKTYTIREVTKDFIYNEYEGKGLTILKAVQL